ncbi:unnamed protein product [Schistosoma curassoni]|uniref:DUF6451 domain-containing protein n=1 Tax=Schistosoma curassoni TaxID=6186 RepID=A0A183JPX1_9TREM|nr:unnamed protein product [Schistosoma curassoni]
MQMKVISVVAASAPVSLNIHMGGSTILKYSTENTNPISFDGKTLEEVKTFTYLDSIIDEQGGSDSEVKVGIGNAKAALLQLKNLWNSKQLSSNIKVRIFNTNVKAVLLYGAESWRTTTIIINTCASISKQLSTQDTECPLTRYYQLQPTVESNKEALI